MRVVDVAAHLLPLAVDVPHEDDGGELAVPNQLLSVPEGEQERRLAQVLDGGIRCRFFHGAGRGGGSMGVHKRMSDDLCAGSGMGRKSSLLGGGI